MKTYAYFQTDKLPGRYFGRMIHVGKVYDTKQNIERDLRGCRMRFSVEVNAGGQLLYTLYAGRDK